MAAILDHLDQFSVFGRSSVAFFLVLGLDWAFSAVHAYDEWKGEEAPLWSKLRSSVHPSIDFHGYQQSTGAV